MHIEKPIRLSYGKPLLQDFSIVEFALLLNKFGEHGVEIDSEKSKVSYNNMIEASLSQYLNSENPSTVNKYILCGRCSHEYNSKSHEVSFELKLKDNDGIMGRMIIDTEQKILDQCCSDLKGIIHEWYKECK